MVVESILGALPLGWTYATLGEACRRGGGDIQTGPFGSQLHAADYVQSGVPAIMPANIGDNHVIEDGIARISEADAQRLQRYRVRVGDIIYSRRGDVERRALVRSTEDGWLCGTGCLRVRLGHRGADPRYAAYYLGHPSVREWIVRHAHGATMANLNTSILSDCPFVIPPLEDQRAIASILGALDDKIELNRRMNETLEALARAIFKSWFVDFDPVRAKAEGRKPFGMDAATAALFPARFGPDGLPEGWSHQPVEALMSRAAMGPFGSRIKTENFVAEGVPIIRGQNLVNGFIDNNFVYLTEGKAQELRSAAAYPGDIVFTHRGTLGQVGQIPMGSRHKRYIVSQSQMLLSVNTKKTSSRLVYWFFRSFEGQHELLANTNPTGVPAIARPLTSLKAIQIITPDPPVARAFDALVEPLEEKAVSTHDERATLASLRDLLLPKLMSSEIRVGNAEHAAERAL
jgi:type I restriction enzyme, S subunit